MNATAAGKAPVHLWIVGVVSLLWNGFGAYDYVMSQTGGADYFASMGLDQAAYDYTHAMPAWATGAWAIGVWVSLLGAILLLLRSRYAVWAFALSLAGALVSYAYQFTSARPPSLQVPLNTVMAVGIVVLIAAQLWYSSKLKQQGVLR